MTANPADFTSADLRQTLKTTLRGRVWTPDHTDFDGVRAPWNRAIEQPALAVVEAADVADVVALVGIASRHGIGISVQPSGHGATGRTAGTVLLRTGLLDTIEIDAASRTATVGAGVRSGALQAAAAAHGLTGLPGSSPVVSVAGVALGGGLSWFGRAYGWVADSVTAFDVVDAEAQVRHVTADTDPDLFWALRGGGGDYAIVTRLELSLHDALEVYGGRLLWSGKYARDVVDAYRRLTDEAPDELTAWLSLMQFPGADPMVAIDSTYLGSGSGARAVTGALDGLPEPISDGRRPMTVAELGSITAEPTDPVAVLSRAELLTAFDESVAATLLADPIAPLVGVQIRHLGGALASASDSPHGALHEPYALYTLGLPLDENIAVDVETKQRLLAESLPVSGRKPVTFLNPSESLADALPQASIARLRTIKLDRDPTNVFRSNFGATG